MHYLLYIPGETRQSREMLDEAGFAGLIRTTEPDPLWFPLDNGGPDGKGGLIVLPFSNPVEAHNPLPGYMPEHQTWEQLPGSDCWIGWQKDAPPTAMDLARSVPVPFPGPSVRLNDGEQWMIPTCMDQKHVMVPNGAEWDTKEQPRWPDLYAKAVPMLDHLLSNQKEECEFDSAAAASFISELLQLNFRLTPLIIGGLSLLDKDMLPSLTAIAIDYARVMRLIDDLKKKEQETPPS